MNSATDLLNKAAFLGIEITASSGKLHVLALKGVVTPKLKEELIANKPEILKLLSGHRLATVYDLIIDGEKLTVIDGNAESLDAFTKSVKARFGSNRVESIIQKK